MEPIDILKKYSKRFRCELEAKPLLMEIRNIFTESTAQEIERIIDREGDIIALERILRTLPMRTNWEMVFYNALNGKEINKPELAKLFKPFINTDSSSKEEEEEEENTKEEKGKKAIYSLDTSINDLPYFQVLKDFYPDDPPNWEYFILKNGLHSSAKLYEVLDNLFVNNKPAYDQIKEALNIRHAYIRQATLDIDNTSLPSASTDMTHTFSVPTSESKNPITSSKESSTKNLTLSSGSLNTEQPHLPPLDDVVRDQEKALKNMTHNPAQENSTVSLPDLPRPDCKSKDRNTKNLNWEFPEDEFSKKAVSSAELSKRNMPQNNINKRDVLEADVNKREVPEAVGSNIEVLKTVDNKEEVPKYYVSKSEVPERIAGKIKFPEANYIEREFPVEDFIQREVPESQEDNNRLMLDVNDIEISETSLSSSTLDTESLETGSSSEVPESYVSEREVPEALENKMEVPQADIREREIPETNVIKQEVLKTVNKKMELFEVEAREPDNDSINRDSSSTKADQEKSSMGLEMSVLLLAIVLSFCFGYYCRAR